MGYCAISDIVAAVTPDDLIELTNDAAGGSTVDNDKITDAISYVDNMIDGFLRGRYSLPLGSTPDELKYIAIDYVVYRLYCRRMYIQIPESILTKYKNVLKTLEAIQKGNFKLDPSIASEYSDSVLKTDKTVTVSSVNKFYTEGKWDTY